MEKSWFEGHWNCLQIAKNPIGFGGARWGCWLCSVERTNLQLIHKEIVDKKKIP